MNTESIHSIHFLYESQEQIIYIGIKNSTFNEILSQYQKQFGSRYIFTNLIESDIQYYNLPNRLNFWIKYYNPLITVEL